MHNYPHKSHKLHAMLSSVLRIYCCILLSTTLNAASQAPTNDTGTLSSDSPEITSRTSVESLHVESIITSEQRIAFDDVYTIDFELPLPGNVQINAVDGDNIVVRLEKHGRGMDEDGVRKYLDAVELSVSKTGEVLSLAPKLPEALNSKTELTRLNCSVVTPPDVSLKIRTQDGNVRINRIRGDIEVTAEIGEIHLNETMGRYKVYSGGGDIHCKILLTDRTNQFETVLGNINLVLLDEISSPTDLTAKGGGITLRLPNSFQAEVEIQTKSQDSRAVSINLPIEVEGSFQGDLLRGRINGGGPLFQLTADAKVEILPLEGTSADSETSVGSANIQSEVDSAQQVPRALQSPVIDGNLFEKAWSKGVALHPFYNADGTAEPDEPTQAYLMWDERYLYIGIKVYIFEMGRLHISQTETGSEVWQDDSIEILVDPNPETKLYYHLIVNPIGTIFSQMVKADYPPDNRFAPAVTEPDDNRKRKLGGSIVRNSQVKPKRNRKGSISDSEAAQIEVETQITSRYWSIEIALLREFLEPESPDNWRLNLLRRAYENREFSYWMPTYDTQTPWWPHHRDRMSRLQFTTVSEESALFGIEEQLEIGDIEIKGNSEIPTPEIVQLIPFQIGEVITASQLSWLVGELEENPWLRKARLDTVPFGAVSGETDDNPLEMEDVHSTEVSQPTTEAEETTNENNALLPLRLALRIHVTEFPTAVHEKFELKGSTNFQSEMLKKWFGLNRGRTSLEDLNAKSQLITKLYKNHGYELVRTEKKLTPNGLDLILDEGRLHEVRFIGINRIKQHELTQTLRLQAGDIYNALKTETQIALMRETLAKHNSFFKDVRDWQARREDGNNVLIITVEEFSPIRYYAVPRVGFNRVHGLILGGSGELSTEAYKGRVFGGASVGLSSSIENFQFGIEKSWFDARELRMGGTWYNLTGVVHSASTFVEEGLLSSAIFGTSLVDFYQRQGYQTWLTQKLTTSTEIALSFTDEQHERLLTVTDWSLFSRKSPKRGNARIDEGTVRSLEFSCYFDTRDYKSYINRPFRLIPWPSEHTTEGWRSFLSVEYSSNRFNSDFNFALSRFEVVRYNRLPNGHNLDFRVMGGLSNSPLPRQRLLYLNLNHILRGFGFNRFIGDSMLALNVEYRVIQRLRHIGKGEVVNGAVSIFLDAGDAWFDGEQFSISRANASIGIGFSLFSNAIPYGGVPDTFRFEIVRGLERRRVTNYILRLSRNF